MGDSVEKQVLGGSSGILEVGCGVAGIGHFQLWPKSSKLLVDVGVADMVRCRGICSPKRRASLPLHRTGI